MMVGVLLITWLGALRQILFTTGHIATATPFLFFFVGRLAGDSIYFAYKLMPANVIVAKLIPYHVETSVFSLVSGLWNLCSLVLAKELGIYINKFTAQIYYENE